MSKDQLTELLGGWEGYRLGTVERVEPDGPGRPRPEIWIELLLLPDHPRQCLGCGGLYRAIHDTTERWIDDLPILGLDTWLRVRRVRGAWRMGWGVAWSDS